VDAASLVTLLGQFGVAVAAWRLANALKLRVDDHETRVNGHERRIGALEAARQ
jgi:hypothetical protein